MFPPHSTCSICLLLSHLSCSLLFFFFLSSLPMTNAPRPVLTVRLQPPLPGCIGMWLYKHSPLCFPAAELLSSVYLCLFSWVPALWNELEHKLFENLCLMHFGKWLHVVWASEPTHTALTVTSVVLMEITEYGSGEGQLPFAENISGVLSSFCNQTEIVALANAPCAYCCALAMQTSLFPGWARANAPHT